MDAFKDLVTGKENLIRTIYLIINRPEEFSLSECDQLINYGLIRFRPYEKGGHVLPSEKAIHLFDTHTPKFCPHMRSSIMESFFLSIGYTEEELRRVEDPEESFVFEWSEFDAWAEEEKIEIYDLIQSGLI